MWIESGLSAWYSLGKVCNSQCGGNGEQVSLVELAIMELTEFPLYVS